MTEQLTPSDCDLRDQPWMPFHVQRLLGSEWWLGASDAAARVSVELWCEAWQQVPAASLPDNDRVLARLAGRSMDEWQSIKDEVLEAWVKCEDGRFYHPTVAQMAVEAWARKCARHEARQKAIESGRKGAAKRWAKSKGKEDGIGCPNSHPIGDPNTLQDKTGQDSNNPPSPSETSPPEGEDPTKPKPKSRRGTRLPDDWTLPKAYGYWAVEDQGMSEAEVRQEAEKFRDYWHAKAGRDAFKVDWQATWRNWIRNRRDPGGGARASPSGRQPPLNSSALLATR